MSVGQHTAHILFIPAEQEQDLVVSVLKRSQDSPTLVVGEATDFAGRGGIINFYVSGNKIRFEFNPAAARRAKLKISAKLLRLGRIVEGRQAHRQ